MISTPLPKRGDSDTKTKKTWVAGIQQVCNTGKQLSLGSKSWEISPEMDALSSEITERVLFSPFYVTASCPAIARPPLGFELCPAPVLTTCHYVHYIHSALLLCPFKFRLAVHILDSANLSKIWSLRLLLSPIVNSELPGCPHHCLQQCFIDASWMMLSETLTSATVTPTNSFSNLLTISIFGYENISQLKFSKSSNFINF